MHIKSIPMRWGSGDNYAYILTDTATKSSWLIDSAFPKDIPESSFSDVKIDAIVNTHHHGDHSGGNATYKKKFGVQIIAGRDSPLVDYTPADGEVLQLGQDVSIKAIHTPCHTQDSICYFAEDKKTGEKALFSGDTLFNSGCGRFFEGTPKEMLDSLGKLARLPSDTVVYPGHEYTKSNVKFSKTVLKNEALDKLDDFCKENEVTTGKFTIKDELAFNPFMRCDDEELKAKLHVADDAELMGLLREMKNNF
ncbi:Hydroxyacylglutathione hydrolase, cytoplasmic isozyme [Cyberlindnera fabianii]|uniref:hydroxyacylglutathione hydrolase n=1 Tax=Cyberlindnera fabianii TaxID=36022 RepID=A0A1V2L4L4_CYBFA|nr:Hydroxyacylglutathione hydrolase, cytoplasmic isozyme [Cyberlindnera fabianii]